MGVFSKVLKACNVLIALISVFAPIPSVAGESSQPYLQCFLLNSKTEPTAYALTPLDSNKEGDFLINIDVPALTSPRYEVAVAVTKNFEIVTSKLTDTIKEISVTTYNLKIAKGDSMQATFAHGEKDIDAQSADCSIKYFTQPTALTHTFSFAVQQRQIL